MYLTHVEDWETVGRVHGEFFATIRPAATMVVVAALLNPAWRIEIEFDAVISGKTRALVSSAARSLHPQSLCP